MSDPRRSSAGEALDDRPSVPATVNEWPSRPTPRSFHNLSHLAYVSGSTKADAAQSASFKGAELTFHQEMSITNKIGEGGYAEVFRGEWRTYPIAIKKFKPYLTNQHRASIVTEVRNATFVSHPNVVRSFGVVEVETDYYLVMELLYCSLYDAISKNSKMSLQIIIKIALDIAQGLKYLHSLSPKIIHRDLKTANLDEHFNAKLSDFGTARELNENERANTITGTLYYMAPEVLDGEPYDEKADIYSYVIHLLNDLLTLERFGAVLFEMATGTHLPIRGKKRELEIEENIKDKDLQQLTAWCCQEEAKDRPNINQCIEKLKLM